MSRAQPAATGKLGRVTEGRVPMASRTTPIPGGEGADREPRVTGHRTHPSLADIDRATTDKSPQSLCSLDGSLTQRSRIVPSVILSLASSCASITAGSSTHISTNLSPDPALLTTIPGSVDGWCATRAPHTALSYLISTSFGLPGRTLQCLRAYYWTASGQDILT